MRVKLLIMCGVFLLPLQIVHAETGKCIEGVCENGHGTYVLPDGTKYKGDFKEKDIAHGYGKIIYPSGNKYVGEFKNDEYDGQGTYTYGVGVYVGKFVAGKFAGQGTNVYKKGEVYVGGWKDGKYHGKGTYIYKNGKTYIGEWKNGKDIKQ